MVPSWAGQKLCTQVSTRRYIVCTQDTQYVLQVVTWCPQVDLLEASKSFQKLPKAFQSFEKLSISFQMFPCTFQTVTWWSQDFTWVVCFYLFLTRCQHVVNKGGPNPYCLTRIRYIHHITWIHMDLFMTCCVCICWTFYEILWNFMKCSHNFWCFYVWFNIHYLWFKISKTV